MIAVDTNVVVRFLVKDDPEQSPRALALIRQGDILVGETVLLECEWVLRAVYGLEQARIHALFLALLGLPRVRTAQPERISQALAWYAAGLDFAGALHLALSAGAEAFATFDARLARRARTLDAPPIVAP